MSFQLLIVVWWWYIVVVKVDGLYLLHTTKDRWWMWLEVKGLKFVQEVKVTYRPCFAWPRRQSEWSGKENSGVRMMYVEDRYWVSRACSSPSVRTKLCVWISEHRAEIYTLQTAPHHSQSESIDFINCWCVSHMKKKRIRLMLNSCHTSAWTWLKLLRFEVNPVAWLLKTLIEALQVSRQHTILLLLITNEHLSLRILLFSIDIFD